MDLKKLIYFNKKKKKKKIVILGNSFYSDAIAYYLKKRDIKFKYIKVESDSNLFLENIFLPEDIAQRLDIEELSTDIKSTFCYDNFIL